MKKIVFLLLSFLMLSSCYDKDIDPIGLKKKDLKFDFTGGRIDVGTQGDIFYIENRKITSKTIISPTLDTLRDEWVEVIALESEQMIKVFAKPNDTQEVREFAFSIVGKGWYYDTIRIMQKGNPKAED